MWVLLENSLLQALLQEVTSDERLWDIWDRRVPKLLPGLWWGCWSHRAPRGSRSLWAEQDHFHYLDQETETPKVPAESCMTATGQWLL